MKKIKARQIIAVAAAAFVAMGTMAMPVLATETADQNKTVEMEEDGIMLNTEENLVRDVSPFADKAQEDLEFQELDEINVMAMENVRLNASGSYYVNFNAYDHSNSYVEYKEFSTGKDGYINAKYGGSDAAYLGDSGDYYIFMLSGVIGKVAKKDVKLVSVDDALSFSYYYVNSGNLYHRLSRDVTLNYYGSSLNNGIAPSYLKTSTNYLSYDGHYFYTDYATLIKDYVNDSRAHAVNSNNPFYNYYQFLPLRSACSYSANELSSLINDRLSDGSVMKDLGKDLVNNQNKYGVNALLTACVAANESGWGSSSISQSKKNLFGLNAVDTSPGQSANYYDSPATCVKDFMETYMSKQYLNPANWKYTGGYLGNKASGINVQYASDPFWGEKAAAIAYSLESKASRKDSGTYTLGIKNTISTKAAPTSGLAIRSEASNSSTTLYNAAPHFDVIFLLKDSTATNGYYKIQSDPVLNPGRTAIDKTTGVYDRDKMYGYVSASYVHVANTTTDGLSKGSDGNWYYYSGGKVDTSFTGLAKNSSGWWYVVKGKVDFNYYGVVKNDLGWWRVEAGKVNFNFNGIAKNEYGTWYLENGKVNFDYTGLVKYEADWWYVVEGKVNLSYTGIVKNNLGSWRVENGKVNFTYQGFTKDGSDWWYMENGKVVYNKTDVIKGVVDKTSGWWYVVDGKILSVDTVARNSLGWWCIRNGKVDFNYNGIAQNDLGYWKIEAGKVNFTFQGFTENDKGIWYMDKGKVQFGTNDVIKGNVNGTNAWWYVVNGKVTYTDTVAKNSLGWWCIRDGKVDFNYNGVAKNSLGWWYIEKGKVIFDYNGVGTNNLGTWYIKNGKVDFDYNGAVEVDGKYYKVVNGKVDISTPVAAPDTKA